MTEPGFFGGPGGRGEITFSASTRATFEFKKRFKNFESDDKVSHKSAECPRLVDLSFLKLAHSSPRLVDLSLLNLAHSSKDPGSDSRLEAKAKQLYLCLLPKADWSSKTKVKESQTLHPRGGGGTTPTHPHRNPTALRGAVSCV